MQNFNFDTIIDRRGTHSMKVDYAAENGYPEDILPLWVADMDFQAPPAVQKALHQMADHGIYGYMGDSLAYFEAVQKWFHDRHGYTFQKEWMLLTPGVVNAVSLAIRAYTEPGDGVLIQQPVYYPFGNMIRLNGRKLLNNPLLYEGGRYTIDFEDFERKIKHAKLFILCSPHNPVGRVWTEEELRRMGEICNRHHVPVLSDELHCDFTFEGYTHTMYPRLGRAFEDNCIVCTAPSKTFNLAGLQMSNIFVPDHRLRKRLMDEVARAGMHMPGTAGLAAAHAAYSEGAEWLDALLVYLAGNFDFARQYLRENIPQIEMVEPEGTYLLWLDLHGLRMEDAQLEQFIVQKAGLWLDMGSMFGEEGKEFARVNMASPRAVIEKAFRQLGEAVKEAVL